jgi:ribosome-binding protein aMBF1 (putative translation factor)
MCDLCSSYGVQTVLTKVNNEEIEVCFECLVARRTYA